MDEKKKQKASITRWLTVGVPCYLSWIIANILLIILFPFLLACGYLGGHAGRNFVRRLCVGFLRFIFIQVFSLIRVHKVVEIPKPADFKSRGTHLFVANHRSWLDGLLLLTLVPDVRIPVNVGYTNAPLLGRVMIWLGCVPVDRKSPEMTLKGIKKIRLAVRGKKRVAVFPEGTRSPIGRLKPFSGFFFRIACDENAPVSPIILHTNYPFLGPGTENLLTAKRANLTIRLLDPISPQKGERGTDLARRVHKAMAPVLRELDTTTTVGATHGSP